jgi:hypothetical protein
MYSDISIAVGQNNSFYIKELVVIALPLKAEMQNGSPRCLSIYLHR